MKTIEAHFNRNPDETIAEILSRYSVLDLREQPDESLDLAEGKYDKAAKRLKVIESGVTDLISWWKIKSGEHVYEVRRFENFAFCSCYDFFFGKMTCKHIYFTTKHFRAKEHREMDESPYLKPTSTKPLETLGGVRF